MTGYPNAPSGYLAELYRDLDGSIRPATLKEVAGCLGLEVSIDLPFVPGMGLAAALTR
jgi:hypothetical protein